MKKTKEKGYTQSILEQVEDMLPELCEWPIMIKCHNTQYAEGLAIRFVRQIRDSGYEYAGVRKSGSAWVVYPFLDESKRVMFVSIRSAEDMPGLFRDIFVDNGVFEVGAR